MQINELDGKVIAVWGLGREGTSVLGYLQKYGIGKEIRVFENDGEADLSGVDIVVKSPGVSLYKPEIVAAKARGIRFTSSSDLFLGEMRSRKPQCPVIGISGSKGKSTSVSALAHMMAAAGRKVGLGGNIGRPIIELLEDDYDYVVGEFSSYQAADLTVSPQIAMFTNLFYVHTDWHNHSHEQYCRDKIHLIAHQQPGDVYFANRRNGQLAEYTENYVGKRRWYNVPDGFHAEGRELFYRDEKLLEMRDLKLNGDHNLDNLCGVFSILDYLGFDIKAAAQALQSFEPLEHRLQNFAEYRGIKFINDSISTAPEAAIGAMKSFDDNIVIISGGQDLDQDYRAYADYVAREAKVKMVVAMYQSGPKIAGQIRNRVHRGDFELLETDDLDLAVAKAVDVLKGYGQGGTVLFSPTAPSFGFYKNFMERGQHFMSVVKNLLAKAA